MNDKLVWQFNTMGILMSQTVESMCYNAISVLLKTSDTYSNRYGFMCCALIIKDAGIWVIPNHFNKCLHMTLSELDETWYVSST